jgi:hypothetical protein
VQGRDAAWAVREHVIAAGGARVRFSRKAGVHLIDRDADVNVEHCVGFEDRGDTGTLDELRKEAGLATNASLDEVYETLTNPR